MFWIGCVVAAFAVIGLPACFLTHRTIRQARTAATLRLSGPRCIVEEHFARIGGIEQWMGIRGEDRENPVLLVIHGGPGSSYSIFTPHLRSWEKHFTIVQWDQRGACRTWARSRPRSSDEMSMDLFTRDGIEVAEFLCSHLGKSRLFLLASSFGSTFGLQIARRRPDLFYAYIGVDQNVGMVRGRQENHREVLERLRHSGLGRGVNALQRIGADPTPWTRADFDSVARWTMKSDPRGFRRTMKLLKDAVWFAPGWKLTDIRAFVRGMHFSLQHLLPEIARFDAWQQGVRFELPFFIFQGENDVLTTPSLAQAYFNDVVAPIKRMILITDAGHFAAARNRTSSSTDC